MAGWIHVKLYSTVASIPEMIFVLSDYDNSKDL